MYCSVKFLSPIVTAGFPLPGWSDDDEPPLDELSSEPHAANVKAMARATASADRPRVHVRLVKRSSSRGSGNGHGRARDGLRGLGLDCCVVDAGAQRARGDEPLEQ